MFPANAHVILKAIEEDAHRLRRLAECDSRPPLAGAAPIGEIAGPPAAAATAASPATANTGPHCAWISFRLGLAE